MCLIMRIYEGKNQAYGSFFRASTFALWLADVTVYSAGSKPIPVVLKWAVSSAPHGRFL